MVEKRAEIPIGASRETTQDRFGTVNGRLGAVIVTGASSHHISPSAWNEGASSHPREAPPVRHVLLKNCVFLVTI
jgi:hypothetical protein